MDSPAFDLLDQAFEEAVGRKVVHARAGGSIPIVPELGLAGAPVILTGIGLPDDGLHSPNEKLDLAQLWSGIRIFGRFFELLGATEPVGQDDEEEEAEAETADDDSRGALILRGECRPRHSSRVARLGTRMQLIDPISTHRPRQSPQPRRHRPSRDRVARPTAASARRTPDK